MVPEVKMVKMVLLESQEMMVSLEIQDLKDQLVIKVVMQLSRIAAVAHHPVPAKVSQDHLAHLVILAYLVDLAVQVLLVDLVDAFLVTVENLEKMVNQVMMESMVNLVNQVSQDYLEIMLALITLDEQISLLT